jgi:hypothetical protein
MPVMLALLRAGGAPTMAVDTTIMTPVLIGLPDSVTLPRT